MILAARGAATIWVRKSETQTLQKVVPAYTVTFPQKEKERIAVCCDAKWAYQRNMCDSSGRIGGSAANWGGEKDRASGRTAGPLGTAGPPVSGEQPRGQGRLPRGQAGRGKTSLL